MADYKYVVLLNEILAELVTMNGKLEEVTRLLQPEPIHVIDMMDGNEVQNNTWEPKDGGDNSS